MPHPTPPRTRLFSAAAGALALLIALSGCSLIEPETTSEVVGTEEGPSTVEDDELGELTVYEVDEAGDLVPAASGIDLEVWEMFREVITPEFAAERILWYQVGDNADSDFLAWVIESDEDPELWNLAVNLAGTEDRDLLLLTLIHEYAHLLSMGPGQTDESGDCEAEMASAACTDDGAYLADYHARFWAGYGDEATAYNGSDEEDVAAFYEAYEDDFVSEYAATNLGEDFAEVFTAFVGEPQPTDPGASVVAEKISYMWEQPELVEIRDRLRAEFGDITWVEY